MEGDYMENKDSLIKRNRKRAQEQLISEGKEYLDHHNKLIKMVDTIPLDTYVNLLIEYGNNGNNNINFITKITDIKRRSLIYTLYAAEVLTTITQSILNSILSVSGDLKERISVSECEIGISRIKDWNIWLPEEDAALIVGWDYISDKLKRESFG